MIVKRLVHLVALCFLLAFLPLQARAVNLCNNAWMNTATTGTGTISLSTTLAGYQSFDDCGITNGQTVRYRIFDGSAWEVGSGTYTTSGTTLTRSVAESSNADAALNLSGGASVIITPLTADLPSESTPTDGTVDEAAYLMTLEGGALKRYLISDLEAALDLADLTGILGLSKGGTAANLTDPGGDRIMFWDDSGGVIDWLGLGTAYAFSTTTLRSPTESLCVAASDETTSLTTGTAKVTFRMPYAFTLTGIRASINTVSSSGAPLVDVNEAGSTIMTTNKLLIDQSEKTSTTAATAATLTDTSLADDGEMTIDIDTAGTGAKGLKVCLIGYQT